MNAYSVIIGVLFTTTSGYQGARTISCNEDNIIDKCEVRCNASDNCYGSQIRSTIDTSVLCETDHACSSSQIYCGNITTWTQDIRDECVIDFVADTIHSNIQIYCNGMKHCLVNSINNQQFISSKLECYDNDQCKLSCATHNSCSDSVLICHSSSHCECEGIGCKQVYHFKYQDPHSNTTTAAIQTVAAIPTEYVIIVINVLCFLLCGLGVCCCCVSYLFRFNHQMYQKKIHQMVEMQRKEMECHHGNLNNSKSTNGSRVSTKTNTCTPTTCTRTDNTSYADLDHEPEPNPVPHDDRKSLKITRNYAQTESEKHYVSQQMTIDMNASGIVWIPETMVDTNTNQDMNGETEAIDSSKGVIHEHKAKQSTYLSIPNIAFKDEDSEPNIYNDLSILAHPSISSPSYAMDVAPKLMGSISDHAEETTVIYHNSACTESKIPPIPESVEFTIFETQNLEAPITPQSKNTYTIIFGTVNGSQPMDEEPTLTYSDKLSLGVEHL
eukprot:149879_1